MPTGSFDLAPILPNVANTVLQLLVVFYTPAPDDDDEGEGSYEPLYNVWCDSIQEREGVDPPVARFHYLTDDTLAANLGWPSQYEQLFPIDAQGPYVVQNDDRLVVLAQTAEGNEFVLFDGFAQIPESQVSPPSQPVSFTAIGVAIRLFDTPITGRVQRNADAADDTSGVGDIAIDEPCRFNPSDTSIGPVGGYIGNCVAAASYTVDEDLGQYPVFLEPLVVERSPDDTSFWFVSDAICYLMSRMILDLGYDQYVQFPTFSTIASLLAAEEPPASQQTLNPGDAQQTDIKIRDYSAANKPYPDVLAELIGYCGFVLHWRTDTDGDGFPQTSLVFSRRDGLATQAPKAVYHAASGATELDPSANNVTQIAMARDSQAVTNQWNVETALKQIEVTVYLAPLFQPNPGDVSSPQNFYLSNLTNPPTRGWRRMYRWYGVDECGDGFYNQSTDEWVTNQGCDFTATFPLDSNGHPTFCRRYRPGSSSLISKDNNGKPLKAVLEIQFNVDSAAPGLTAVGDSSMWLTVPHGWELLDDRLAIRVRIENPEQWGSGNPKVGDIRGITWAANPPTGKNFALRLTTVIDSDQRMNVTAAKRIASPTQFTRTRSADAKDHFQHCKIDLNSLYYQAQGGNGTDPLIPRNDKKDAITHAEQLRTAHEMPPLAGSLKIPFITDFYEIGDRIDTIEGRNVDLTTNVGINQGESPVYPWIVARTWNFSASRQETVLQLTDRRAERANL